MLMIIKANNASMHTDYSQTSHKTIVRKSDCLASLNLLTGVAVGSEFCGAESPALRDSGVWVVDIGRL